MIGSSLQPVAGFALCSARTHGASPCRRFAPRLLRHGLVLVGLLLMLSRPAFAVEERQMTVGEDLTLSFPGLDSFAVENPQVVRITDSRDGRTLIVRGLRAGSSKVRIVVRGEPPRVLDIHVTQRSVQALLSELNAVLQGYPDIQLRTSGSTVLMEGSVKTEQELANIKEIEKKYEGHVSNLVSVGPSGARRNVMIRLDLHYVQVHSRLARQLGVRYPQTITGMPIPGAGIANFFLTPLNAMEKSMLQTELVNNLMPSLDLNESNGFVKVMRTDTLITENGSKAVYRDGTEAYIRLLGTLGAGQLETVFYGSELTVTPRLSASNDAVSVDLLAELSQRDLSGTSDGIPNRLVDRIETNVFIPIGQSVMIAGVNARSMTRNTMGLPWLNRIPIIGYLFGSEHKDAESVYGVVFITPTIVQDSPSMSKRQIDQALEYFESPRKLPR